MALVIDASSGTVLDLDDCYIVEDENFTPEQEAIMNSGSDTLIAELAVAEGYRLDKDAIEAVKYARLTSVSYGPSALRDEARVLLEVFMPESDDPEDIALRDSLKWVAEEANDATLCLLGQHILNDDAVWNGYRANFIEGLRYWANMPEPF